MAPRMTVPGAMRLATFPARFALRLTLLALTGPGDGDANDAVRRPEFACPRCGYTLLRDAGPSNRRACPRCATVFGRAPEASRAGSV